MEFCRHLKSVRLALQASNSGRQRCGQPRTPRPDLTRTAVYLADIAGRVRQREAAERFGRGIETNKRVTTEVAQPHPVRLVYVDRVRLWRFAGQPPLSPGFQSGVVDGDLPRVPLAHPNPSSGISPDSASPLPCCRWVEFGDFSRRGIDATDITSGERGEINIATGRSGDAIRPAAAWRVEYLHRPGFRLEPSDNAILPREHKIPCVSKTAVLRFAFGLSAGSGKTDTSSVSGSTRTIALSPLSVIHAAPSGPVITPCGADPALEGCRASPRSPDRAIRVSPSPARYTKRRRPPLAPTSCGCEPAGTS